jgi:hypothetical protein
MTEDINNPLIGHNGGPLDPIEALVLRVQTKSRPDGTRQRTLPRPKHPRLPGKRPGSGWKGHPNSLAALEKHRHKGGTHRGSTTRRCDKCEDIAVLGKTVCRRHGGQPEINARRKLDPNFRPRKSAMVRSELRRALRTGELPFELMQQPIFLRVLRGVVNKSEVVDGDYHAAAAHRRLATRLVLEFLQAWVVLNNSGDGGPWASAVVKARDAGFA